eukprot:TRINITY_DN3812_c0_g1_i1.p1 TRINITY_DN3812_c0_g1~~TRINITY_DN3812_c0_g1_i1.p1  ORF type:complete len:693 (-),score=102.59 TRINITY_DN3812_c0_g1_i1:114-2099(-)
MASSSSSCGGFMLEPSLSLKRSFSQCREARKAVTQEPSSSGTCVSKGFDFGQEPTGAIDQEPSMFQGPQDRFKNLLKLDIVEYIWGPKADRPRRRSKPEEDFENWSLLRRLNYRIVTSRYFDRAICMATAFNMIVIIVEVDSLASYQEVPDWILWSITTLMWIYALDISLKLYAHGLFYLANVSNMVDAIVVLVDLFDYMITLVVPDPNIPSLIFLRTLRLLRLYRLVKSVLVFREFFLMMQGFLNSVRAIVFGAFMILLALTTWSILAVQFLNPVVRTLVDAGEFDGCKDCEQAFGSVLRSIVTLWKTIIAGDSWGTLAVPLLTKFPSTSLILIPAFISVQLGVVNVIAAVILDRQTQARQNDDQLAHQVHQEELAKSYQKLRELFESLDEDGGGSLTLAELANQYQTNVNFRAMLDVLDIQASDIPAVYEIMDEDNSGEITYKEFVEKLHYIKFLNEHTLLVFIKQNCDVVRARQDRLQESFDSLLNYLSNMVQPKSDAVQRHDFLRQTASSEPPQKDAGNPETASCLPGGLASDDFQKQLSDIITSIMLPAAAQVVHNVVSISVTGDCADSDSLVAKVDSSMHRTQCEVDQLRFQSTWGKRLDKEDLVQKEQSHQIAKTSAEAIGKSSPEPPSLEIDQGDSGLIPPGVIHTSRPTPFS